MNTTTYIGVCRSSFTNTSSYGLWENLNSPDVVFGYSLPLLEMQILLIFIFIAMSHMFLRYIGISHIASHMIAGLILGPHLLDLLEKSSTKLSIDPALDGNATLKGISLFGSIMSSFLMTVRTSRRVAFSSGKLPVVIGISSFIAPMLSFFFKNLFLDSINPEYMPLEKALAERAWVIFAQSAMILPSITYILLELNILNSELGRLALSASVINEVLGIFFLVLGSVARTYTNISHVTAYRDFIGMTIFFLMVFIVFKPIVERIIDRTPEGQPVKKIYVHLVILITLASSVYTMVFNMRNILGPLVIGLFIPAGPPLGSELEAMYEKLTMNVFLPITIALTTMRCDGIRIFKEFDDIFFNILLSTITLVLKLLACLAPCLYYKLPLKESIAVSIIMSYKSFSDFLIYQSGLENSHISQATYAFLIIQGLLIVGIVPMVIRTLYDPKRKYVNYQKRNILNLEQNSNLRILTCLHKPDNISETIAFLQLLSSPNLDFPISVTVLNLIKLLGQINPVLVSQNNKSKRVLNNWYIRTSNLAFKEFMLDSSESITMTTYTAFSHENLMHDDICTLALDQTVSMIIVPSGRRWTVDGVFESDDNSLRRLNQSLLESSPCSVGILIDRGKFSHISNVTRNSKTRYNIDVGVIFVGGKDDREALSLVKRMKHNPRVYITVIRLIYKEEIESENWDYILDNECLKDINIIDGETSNNVGYMERNVTDGAELVTTIRLLAGEYDVMVVGRDHNELSLDFVGLTDWVELPELGIIGDLLAAKDLSSKVSVLVVQQQQQL